MQAGVAWGGGRLVDIQRALCVCRYVRVNRASVNEQVNTAGGDVVQFKLALCVTGGNQAGAADADFDARQWFGFVVEDLAAFVAGDAGGLAFAVSDRQGAVAARF